jgi:hypothetical protein
MQSHAMRTNSEQLNRLALRPNEEMYTGRCSPFGRVMRVLRWFVPSSLRKSRHFSMTQPKPGWAMSGRHGPPCMTDSDVSLSIQTSGLFATPLARTPSRRRLSATRGSIRLS